MDQAMAGWPARVAAEAALERRGRTLDADVLIEVGDRAWLAAIRRGQVVELRRGPFVLPSLHACPAHHRRGHGPLPRRRPRCPAGTTCWRCAARARCGSKATPRSSSPISPGSRARWRCCGRGRCRPRRWHPPPPGASRNFEPVTGRYLRMDIEGRPHRVYVEEAGEGTPLLLLHTAGSDGRQWRDLLNDAEITSRFRCIAFDMPWHGKSSPPAGWESEEYRLTTAGYTGLVMAVARALKLDRPIVMGCSIGGRIVLDLAAEHPDALRGVIGLQGSAFTGSYYDLSVLHHARIHGGEVCGAMVSGLIGPSAPKRGKVGDAVALHAGRARRVPRRPAFLRRGRRSARQDRPHRHRRAARWRC